MELIAHELSRVVYLTNVARREGGVFLPELAQKVLQRYSFVKFPNVDDLQRESQTFGLGKFQELQVDELKVYSDGVIVSGKCNTGMLEAFVADLFGWIKAEFGLEELSILKPEMHFESGLLFRPKVDITTILSPPKRVANLIERTMLEATQEEYQPTTIYFEADTVGLSGRRRPNRFTVERRIGLPFSANVFYSQAPLRSESHFALLEGLEALAD